MDKCKAEAEKWRERGVTRLICDVETGEVFVPGREVAMLLLERGEARESESGRRPAKRTGGDKAG